MILPMKSLSLSMTFASPLCRHTRTISHTYQCHSVFDSLKTFYSSLNPFLSSLFLGNVSIFSKDTVKPARLKSSCAFVQGSDFSDWMPRLI